MQEALQGEQVIHSMLRRCERNCEECRYPRFDSKEKLEVSLHISIILIPGS